MFRRFLPLFVACALSAATGCDPASGGHEFPFTQDDTDNGSMLEEDEEELEPTHLLQCEQPVPCDAMALNDPEASGGVALGEDTALRYSETERCVLETLASGRPALVQTVADFDDSTAFLDFALAGDGIVLRQAHGAGDRIGSWTNSPSDCQLRSSEFFQGCLESHDPECLIPDNWVETCEDLGGLICPELASPDADAE